MASANYEAQRDAISHEVQYLIEIVLDRCSNTYTQAPCTASDAGDGSRCWYSWPTCQDLTNYSKTTRTYRFCLGGVGWPDTSVQVYPLLLSFVPTPQKIDPKELLTTPEKVKLEFALWYDPPPPDVDKGAGYFNTSYVGEYWRNLFARNRNYPGRTLRIKRGFNATGHTVASDFEQVGTDYKLTQVQITDDKCVIEAESILADLKKVKAPNEVSDDNTLQANINDSVTSLTVNDASEFYDPADYTENSIYIEIGSEIMEVTAINTSTNVLTVTRAQWGTAAASHTAGDEITQLICLGDNTGTGTANDPDPITTGEALLRMLEWGQIPSASVDTAAFTALDDGFWPTADILTTLRKSDTIAKHIKTIRETRGLLVYLGSDGKFTVSPMAPDTEPTEIDRDKLVDGSVKVKEDDEHRLTRVAIFYDPSEDNSTNPADYRKAAIVIDTELEDANNYNDVKDERILDKWLNPDATLSTIRNTARRLLARRSGGVRTFEFELALKDADTLGLGDSITIVSDELLGIGGEPEPRACIVTYRKETSESRVQFRAVDMNLRPGARGFLRVAPNTAATSYDSATDEDKAYGYWGDSDNRVGTTKEPGYIFW